MYTRPPASDLVRPQLLVPATRELRPNWWLRLTSMAPDTNHRSFASRERVRRSRLASWLILGILGVDLILIPISAGSPATIIAIATVFVGLLLVAVCNRIGWVTFSGFTIVVLITAAVFGSIVSEPNGLSMFDIPGYDILVVTVVVGASILPPISAFFIAAINASLVVLDFSVQPHAADVHANIQLYGTFALVARPIALLIIVAVVSYLWVQGTHREIRRADRAEEVAALEHAYAEQSRQLEIGVQQILATHVRIANGDFSARAPLSQDNVLWQIAASLNNLLGRLQKAGQAEYRLQRTDDEIDRLVVALRDLQAQRRPIWPAPAGTSADKLLAVLAPARLRQPDQPSQFGQRPSWEGLPRRQQGQVGPSWDSYGPSGPGSGTGGMSQFPPLGENRSWSEPPEWLGPGTGYGGGQSPSDPGGQRFFGQPPSSKPPMPQDPASGGPSFAQPWPSLDPVQADNDEWNRRTSDTGSSPGEAFPPLDNPWYLPPDE
jgi:hypothetical protein